MPLQDKSLTERLYPATFVNVVTTWCGSLAPIAGIATIILTTRLIPAFSWQQNQLAVLGNTVHTYFWVFKAGMIVTGILGIPFAKQLWEESEQPLKKSATLLYLTTYLSIGMLGYTAIKHDLYLSLEMGTHFLLLYTIFIYGTGEIFDERMHTGLRTIWLGLLTTTVWFAWIGGFLATGSAVPEAISLAAFYSWTFWKSVEHSEGLLDDIAHLLAVLRDEIGSRLPF